jgi:hypothetical protein
MLRSGHGQTEAPDDFAQRAKLIVDMTESPIPA